MAEDRPRDEHGKSASQEEPEPERTQDPEESESSRKKSEGTKESRISAPSIGPKTVIDRPPPEERLAKHEQSQVDAMGLDKHREVAGGSYGPSAAKQIGMYGAFVVVSVALVIAFLTVVDRLDQPPEVHRSEAPWAQPAAPQTNPTPLDSPRNGSPNAGL
jgi:hypothetical protein